MKRIFNIAIAIMAMLSGGTAATIPLYDNNSELIAPTLQTPVPVIDARAWVNRALFSVSTISVPFEAYNNVRFTNQNAVQMFFDPGVRFRNRSANSNGWAWMDTWINRGAIVTDHTTFLGSLFGSVFSFDSRASILQVAATNILAQGPLSSGTHGLIRLEGRRVDVSRNTLRTGSAQTSNILFGSTLNVGISNYVNDVGIRDLYWGVGQGDALSAANRSAMLLTPNSIYPSFNPTNPASSIHEVIQPSTFGGFLFTNSTIVPNTFFFSGNNAFINTNNVQYLASANLVTLSATSRLVQVVFYPSNVNDPDFSTEVRFYPTGPNRAARPAVAFHAKEFDITTRATSTNSVYLVDALPTTTNSFLARNSSGGTRRPNTFSVTRLMPFEYRIGIPGGPLASNTFYGNNYTLTQATNRYAAYAAQVELLSSSSSGSIPYDVTNAPGRIEIIGDEVNLDQTRIRAESAVIIKAQNLVSNNFAQVDAPLVNFDARSVQPVFNIVNLAPTAVRRFGGAVRAWSAVWDNFEAVVTGTNVATNTVTFHVLIVESQLRSTVPVTVNEFAARATNVVIGDQLNIAKSFVVEGNALHVTGGISLPAGRSMTASNLLNVRNFTNDGVITVQGSAFYGTDRALSYSNWVNHGTNAASSIEVRSRNFENSGALVAARGAFTLDAVTASMLGNPLITSNSVFTNISFDFFSGFLLTNVFTNTATLQAAPLITASSDVDIRARDFTMSNAIINAGTLILNVTNRVADSGTQATNFWNTASGFQTYRRPTTSSLFGTHVRSSAPFFGLSDHVWAGADLGNTNTAFTNNLALGKLTFDGGENSLFRFFPAGTSNALYVDYIQLENWATNFNSAFSISPNFTIYFANANVPVTKLHGAAGGRFQWVRSFAGPLSSTNITYQTPPLTGQTFTFNIALVTDNDIDSDGDGLVNSEDPEPIDFPVLSAAVERVPDLRVLLRWGGVAYSQNIIEYSSGDSPGQWNLLTNLQMGPFNHPVTIVDPVGTNGQMRVYRLRVNLQ